MINQSGHLSISISEEITTFSFSLLVTAASSPIPIIDEFRLFLNLELILSIIPKFTYFN